MSVKSVAARAQMIVLLAVVLASLQGSMTFGRVQDESAPKLLRSAPQPVYPPAATRAGVEGAVEFTALVEPSGTVRSVEVLKVPRPGVGFEDAVRDAVRQWQFTAPTRAGAPVAGTYTGTIQFVLSIPGEWMYPVSSHEMWGHVRALIKELKLSTERLDEGHHLVVTRTLSYRSEFPDARALDLPPGQIPATIQFHLFVANGIEPARVAIGSIIQTKAVLGNREGLLIYANPVAADWLMTKLSTRSGKTPDRLAGTAERRAEQSRRLLPAGVSDACSQREAVLLPQVDTAGPRPPRVLSQVQPVYPWKQLENRRESDILFTAEITEHGTLMNVVHTSPSDAPEDFKKAAQLAASLWRFEPAAIDGCLARVNATFEMHFKVK